MAKERVLKVMEYQKFGRLSHCKLPPVTDGCSSAIQNLTL
jgi:hypothetical protein